MRNRQQVESEIRNSLGFLPKFWTSMTDHQINVEWERFKMLQLTETEIPVKYRALYSLSNSIRYGNTTPYARDFYTALAEAAGATKGQIREAISYGQTSVGQSALINNVEQTYKEFSSGMKLAPVASFEKELEHA